MAPVGISSTMLNPPEAVLTWADAAFFLAAAALRFWFFLADFVFGFASDHSRKMNTCHWWIEHVKEWLNFSYLPCCIGNGRQIFAEAALRSKVRSPTWLCSYDPMADVIKKFNYSKTRGRGRGILGLTNFDPCRRPGERSSSGHHQSLAASQSQCEAKEARVESQTEESAGVYVIKTKKKKKKKKRLS